MMTDRTAREMALFYGLFVGLIAVCERVTSVRRTSDASRFRRVRGATTNGGRTRQHGIRNRRARSERILA